MFKLVWEKVKRNWYMLAGALVLVASVNAMTMIWANVKTIEMRRYTDHVNLVVNVSETARVFIANNQFMDFYKIIHLLTQIPFVEGIAVFLENEKRLAAGEQDHLDDYAREYAWAPNRVSYVDARTGRFFVKQKLDYLPEKDASIVTVFTLGEALAAKRQILFAFVVVGVLLLILLGLGIFLYNTIQKLNDMHKKLKETEQIKEDMIYSITHDAKQDLTVIQGKISALIRKKKKGDDLPHLEKDLKNAKEAADSIDRFLNNLNDQQRLQKGEIEMMKEDIDLVDSITSAMHAMEEQMANRGMVFKFESEMKTCLVRADSQVLRRVLNNIIHNAIKFSPFNSAIAIALKKSSGRAKVQISDQGPGIDEKYWKKIFLPYMQIHPKKEGMGLGLATSKKLMQLMDGDMGVAKSEVGKGTMFYFTLPLPEK